MSLLRYYAVEYSEIRMARYVSLLTSGIKSLHKTWTGPVEIVTIAYNTSGTSYKGYSE